MRDRIAMALSVLTRMGVGLLVFVLMARGLGPEAYGLVVTVMAYATLVSLVTDFGFASKTLRDIAADRPNGGQILNTSLNVKLYFTGLAMLVGGGVILLLPVPLDTRLTMIMLAAAVLIAAVGDLSLTAYRAVGKFVAETWLTLWTSTVHLVVIGWIALAHGDVMLLAIAFLVSRTIYAILALRGSLRLFPNTGFTLQRPGTVLHTARGAWSWAVDSGLNYLGSQADGLVVAGAFGVSQAGIYQAGSRFVQAAIGLVVVLSSIHIPRLASTAKAGRGQRFSPTAMLEFAGVGALCWLGFWILGPFISRYLLGPAYLAVDELWVPFGALVFLRYVSAGAGAQLIALNMPRARVSGQIVGLAVMILSFLGALQWHSLSLITWSMVGSAGAVAIVYWGTLAYLSISVQIGPKPTDTPGNKIS